MFNFNDDIAVVYDCPRTLDGLGLYTFISDISELGDVKKRIADNQAETASRWLSVYGEDWRVAWLNQFGHEFEDSYKNLRAMPFEDYENFENERLSNQPLHEITQERFIDLLECLPPLKWSSNALFESFFMSEAYTGNWRDQVMRITVDGENRYFTKLRTFDNAFNYADLIQAMGVNK